MKKLVLAALLAIILLGLLLRFYRITSNPPGLYVDEVSIGLNAYDILKTGKDQYGVSYPLAFESLGDYKMPLYIYMTSLAMSIFGKNEFAVRVTSATAGTLTILVIFFLAQELFSFDKSMKKYKDTAGLLSALLLAILPWHLLISRGGFEVTLAVFLYTLALLLWVKFIKNNKTTYLLIGTCLLALTMFTYPSYRGLAPFTVLAGVIYFFKDNKKRRNVIYAAGLFLLLCLPVILFSTTSHGMARFNATSAFVEDPYTNILLRLPTTTVIFIRNYLSYFSLTYLFRYGDQINRDQLNNFGLLYIWQLPFILAGVYFLTKTSNKTLRNIILLLFLIGPIPAAFARPSPHSLRFLIGTVAFSLLTIVGIYQLSLQKKQWVKGVYVATALIALIEFSYYFHLYYVQYPRIALLDWGGGCKQVAQAIYQERNKYNHFYVENELGCIPEYFAFYIPQIPVAMLGKGQTVQSNDGKSLYVRPFYPEKTSQHLIRTVRLANQNQDIFAQFWQL